MKIKSIPEYSQNQSKLSFQAGKVRVFADFDNTYLPDLGKNLAGSSPIFIQMARKSYFEAFKRFFQNTREGLRFTITTGRTLGEFEAAAQTIKSQGIDMPLPDTLIAKNGSDEYVRTCSDEDFYSRGEFPFKYDITNKDKEAELKKLTGWDGPLILSKIKEIISSYGFETVEGDSEHSARNYGGRSLFAKGKLSDNGDKKVGFRKDGNCKIFYTLPRSVDFQVAQEIREKVSLMLQNMGVKYHNSEIFQYKHECGGRPYCEIVPKAFPDEKYRHNPYLTKAYDTRYAIKEALKNNDLVIAAGDSSNDLPMFNLLQYLPEDLIQKYKTSSGNDISGLLTSVSGNLNHEFFKDYPDLEQAYLDLPFIGIVVKRNNPEKKPIIRDECNSNEDKYKKIIFVEEGKLEDGIREAVRLYCSQNPEYRNKLSPDLEEEIFCAVKDGRRKNPNNADDSNNGDSGDTTGDKSNTWKYIAIGGGIGLGLLGGGSLYLKHKKDKESEVGHNESADKQCV